MAHWSEGYAAELGYTHGYYSELNPHYMRLAMLSAGITPPSWHAGAAACELGFGQGGSLNIHAAASGWEWYGTDFAPAQAGYAVELAGAGQTGAHVDDQSFEEFCQRDDLPDFSFVALHGIWSWVSARNREVIVDFLRRKLVVGGVVYFGYNTQPGWAPFMPMRELIVAHAEQMSPRAVGTQHKLEAAVAFVDKLLATEPAFLKANPGVSGWLKDLKKNDPSYLAHEYLNQHWHPEPFDKMAAALVPAKLSFACSANFLDHVDPMVLSTAQQKLLAEIADPVFRESVRDLCVNRQFRRDYWVRGPRPLSSAARAEALRRQRVLLCAPASSINLNVRAPVGDVELSPAVYKPILELLSDHRPRSIGEIEVALQTRNIALPNVVQALVVLASRNQVWALQDEEGAARQRPRAASLNKVLFQQFCAEPNFFFVASPQSGGGMEVAHMEGMFLAAYAAGAKKPPEAAQWVWRLLQAKGQAVLRDGKALATPHENVAELTRQAELMWTVRLPVLRALQVVD